MSLKQIQNSTLFGEIQTSTVTFIAYLTRFRLISFKNPHRIPTGPWGFITVPIPIPYPYPWESHGNLHTHGSPEDSVATRLRCGGIFNDQYHCIAKSSAECASERILKIGQYSTNYKVISNLVIYFLWTTRYIQKCY